MPELPEVETVRRGLERSVLGREILAVRVGRERSVRRVGREAVEHGMLGAAIESVERRGKYLIAVMDNGNEAMIHLRMSGRLLIADPGAPAPAHSHVVVSLAGRRGGVLRRRAPREELRFVDPRTFGEFAVYPSALRAEVVPEWTRLGVDPVIDRFDGTVLRRLLGGRKRPIKAVLLDQSVVAGIGNIYADESLHRAGLRWSRRADSLSGRTVDRLADAIAEVLAGAIAAGGSTLDDTQYMGVDGEHGWFQLEHRVYGRAGELCTTCGKGRIVRETVAGRSTWYCRRCQR